MGFSAVLLNSAVKSVIGACINVNAGLKLYTIHHKLCCLIDSVSSSSLFLSVSAFSIPG